MLDKTGQVYSTGHGHLVRIYHKILGLSNHIFACKIMQTIASFKQRAGLKNLRA